MWLLIDDLLKTYQITNSKYDNSSFLFKKLPFAGIKKINFLIHLRIILVKVENYQDLFATNHWLVTRFVQVASENYPKTVVLCKKLYRYWSTKILTNRDDLIECTHTHTINLTLA